MKPFQPISFEEADTNARSILASMTLDEKIAYVGGDRMFFIRSIPRLHLKEVYMADATQGIHIRNTIDGINLSDYYVEKSTAFPCPLMLAATWNPGLSYKYAEAIGEECRAVGIGILLGPGMNIYRHAQCGRNFEYFGEDPFLASRMIEQYVHGVQSTGTVATLKHFAANNTDYFRRKSNSLVDERTLHEIYLPAFKAGIDAGAGAVMTAYNLLNGEWCGQSRYVIQNLLRNQLGFTWMVMTDWWSVWDGEKVATSGQDLEMPHAIALRNAHRLIEEGKISEHDIDRMALSILRTYFAMKLDESTKDPAYLEKFAEHETIALQTAREGIVLLKNEDNILPINDPRKTIIVTGDYVDKLARGGGSAEVEGYNNRSMIDELKRVFGDRLHYIKEPSVEEIKAAGIVLCNGGTFDSEGWDRPFELPDDQEKRVMMCVDNNPNTVVIVTSGSGIRMTDWHDRAKAILFSWYGGQTGNTALAEIVSGQINPSGKLPITIEKEFKDSPGYGYIPEGESLYNGWNDEEEKERPVYDVHYKEGIFVGYRWYENSKIEPLYPFGHGLSYTSFEYNNLSVTPEVFGETDNVKVSFTLINTGTMPGAETAQVYIEDLKCSYPRPPKELKGFQKVRLQPGESKTITIELDTAAFSFWHPEKKKWIAERGSFVVHVGSSSADIQLKRKIELQ
jgi:beta-glucosidase